MNKTEINAACWAALEAMARKECRRDALVAGARYDVTLRMAGEVRAKPFACEATARVIVNQDGVRLVSQSPPIAHLVAIFLGLLPRSQRENVLRNLPERFDAADKRLPDVDAALVEAAESLLKRLRARTQQQVRGSVSTSYTVHHV